MKREIKIVRCDRCGKRVHDSEGGKMTLRQSTWNYSNTYDICQSCFNFFRREMKYMESVKDIFSVLSEEALLKDDPEEPIYKERNQDERTV